MSEEREHVSWSQIKQHHECPLQWQLDRVVGVAPSVDSVHTVGGTAFHETVQEWLRLLYGGGDHARFPMWEDFLRRLRGEFERAREKAGEGGYDLPFGSRDVAEYAAGTRPVLAELRERSAEFFDPAETELVGIEVPIEREVAPEIDVVGYLDVVLRRPRDGRVQIVDIKTSTKGWGKWKREDPAVTGQLALYRHFYAEQEPGLDVADVSTWFLICQRGTNKWNPDHVSSFTPPTGPEARREVLGWMHDMLAGAFRSGAPRSASPLPKRPGRFKCPWCPYSHTFGGSHPICDEDGLDFEPGSYPEGMRPYIDDIWIDG